MDKLLIKNAQIINEGKIINSDIFINNGFIEEISSSISIKSSEIKMDCILFIY